MKIIRDIKRAAKESKEGKKPTKEEMDEFWKKVNKGDNEYFKHPEKYSSPDFKGKRD